MRAEQPHNLVLSKLPVGDVLFHAGHPIINNQPVPGIDAPDALTGGKRRVFATDQHEAASLTFNAVLRQLPIALQLALEDSEGAHVLVQILEYRGARA
eukprot:CAMPEP_0202036730 /NCGR_PEP_ID=MMETSP0962-20130828/1739_1 /ASSEMBLY_ACC=CAM_ASM_000488 /TAXON_ID=4773 /ORGANISM="Schizochytrium aggregatum, Strain ATCC28209" /LENGTH=97 /DNA_ID=CAMNT_0048600825 /DNA_START=153 /DNA_END=446 /DNA_ORIENTATION=-